MKKLLKTIITTTALAMVLVAGVAVGAHQEAKVEKAAADEVISGNLYVELDNRGKWSADSAKLAAYMTNDKKSAWTELQSISSDTRSYIFSYSVDFTPTKLIWVRLYSSATSGDWNKKHNQTGDLAWKECSYLPDQWDPAADQCSQWNIYATVNSSSVSYGVKETLRGITINDQGHKEVSGSVSLAVDEQFKVVNAGGTWSGYYGCPAAIDGCFTGGSKTGRDDSDPNITCLEAGTYDFFFDTETNKIWLTRQDIVDADGYASYFLSHVKCDESGKTLPAGWSDCASTYASLSAGGKDYLYSATGSIEEGADNIARCVYWYDYAVRVHPSLTKFMKNSSNVVRASSGVINTFDQTISKDTTAILATVIIVVASLTAVGGFFLLKKKKEIK